MKKIANKITKYLLLFIMVIYDMMTPITVLAAGNGENGIEKGSVGINNAVSSDGGNSVTVSATNGNVTVNKTVRKTDTEGKYEVSFHISGEEVETTTTSTVPVYAVVVFDKSGSMYERECLRYEYSIFGRYCAERGDEIKFSSAVEGAGKAFEGIADMIEKVNANAQEMQRVVESLTSGTESIKDAFSNIKSQSDSVIGETENVSAASEEQSASMQEIAEASQKLSEVAEQLEEAVAKFKL